MIRKVLLAAALAAALGPLAFAQRGGGGGRGGGGMGGMGGGGFPGGFGQAQPVDKLEAITKELKLTDAQKTDVLAIMDDGQKQTVEIRKKRDPLRQQMINQNLRGEDTAESIKQIAVLNAQIKAIEVDAFGKIMAKLDDKQKSKGPKLLELIENSLASNQNWRAAR